MQRTSLASSRDRSRCFRLRNKNAGVTGSVGAIWSSYRSSLDERFEKMPHATQTAKRAALAEIIREDQSYFKKYSDLDGLGAGYGTHIAKTHADDLNGLETEIFDGVSLTQQLRRDLRTTVEFMYGKKWIHPTDRSGVVIAGMGEEEAFPALLQFLVGTIAGGKLRHYKENSCRIGVELNASVVPFARRETIDTIIAGIHPDLVETIFTEVDRLVPRGRGDKTRNAKRVERFKEDFEKHVLERYDGPFMAAVSGLPRQDLAKMAEALVSLTAFVMRMTADQEETVAEPIDVALLSKGDGFTWVKHKDLIHEAGRLAF